MSFLRKLRNRLLTLIHVVFSQKFENSSIKCHFWGNFEIDYLVWTMFSFQRNLRAEAPNVIFEDIEKETTCFETCSILKENWEVKCTMAFLREFRYRLLALNHDLLSRKIENRTVQCHFWENTEIDYFLLNMLYFQRKLRTQVSNVIFEET